ncbi:Carbonic anhydrase [Vibrio stylophorae]|uniref:Carbonic anhydrase n=1 Tax=Vibrio stylophorae TaxID=659351 RepID=A0ABM8ZS61_9VIBR|nr:carbonic anhydrase family protein [Vibrio stylophorae]CAH0533133.1 Carbonic anhydrase [Vibrio stylophorae]
MKQSGLVAIIATLVFSHNAFADEHGHWGYEGKHAPAHWGETFETCGTGLNQSPINIADSVEAELSPLAFTYQGEVINLTNNGHTLQAGLTGDNQVQIDGQSFVLKQFHFHTPSENTVKGQHYPLEAHFVNSDAKGNLAVVAVMFEEGKANADLAKLIATLPKTNQQTQLSQPFATKALLANSDSYYRFNGSLTTPPCSEGVRWFVLEKPLTASKQQIAAMQAVMGNNNRPVQALNARLVLDSE